MTALETIARAICGAKYTRYGYAGRKHGECECASYNGRVATAYGPGTRACWDEAKDQARAVVVAMMEPSAGMIVAAREKADLINYPITDPWEAMLQYILEEKP